MGLIDITGKIERRILINYRVAPQVLKPILPPQFSPRVKNGFTICGICLIQFSKMRPTFLPEYMGSSSENGTHRFCVQWNNGENLQKGVYVLQRFTNSRLHELGSNLLSPGALSFAKFNSYKDGDEYGVKFQSNDGYIVNVKAKKSNNFSSSVYDSLEEVSHDFETDSIGYSPSQKSHYNGVEIITKTWKITPMEIISMQSSFFENENIFPKGSVELDHCFFMEDINHTWRSVDSICDNN